MPENADWIQGLRFVLHTVGLVQDVLEHVETGVVEAEKGTAGPRVAINHLDLVAKQLKRHDDLDRHFRD